MSFKNILNKVLNYINIFSNKKDIKIRISSIEIEITRKDDFF